MLLSKRNFKSQLGDVDLELEAKTGQGLIIKNIQIFNPAGSYITVSISKSTVGYFRVDGLLGSHLSFHVGSYQGYVLDELNGHINQTTLLEYLLKLGLFTGYPVSSGEKFVITGAKQDDAIQCVEYEIWEAADITPEMENGSKSTSFFYINYGNTGDTINVSTDVLLDTSNNPAEFPDFPFGAIVPANRNIELHGILASDIVCSTEPGNYTYTQFLKFMQGKVFLFDEDRQGLLYTAPKIEATGGLSVVAAGRSLGGNYSDFDLKYPFFFDPPLIFPQGQELTIYWKCSKVGDGSPISLELQEVALILKIVPVS